MQRPETKDSRPCHLDSNIPPFLPLVSVIALFRATDALLSTSSSFRRPLEAAPATHAHFFSVRKFRSATENLGFAASPIPHL